MLVQTGREAQVIAAVFHETTTIGLRSYRTGRHVLRREIVEGAGGAVKVARRPEPTAKLEADEIKGVSGAAARARIRARAEAAALEGLDDDEA